MSRVQLTLNVTNIDTAVEFYSKLFATEPAKRRPGYANFAIVDPPLKLVLIKGHGGAGSLNHLGVEVTSTDEVAAATARLSDEGLATATEDEAACCYGPSRARCGSTLPTASRGRSTPCSVTSKWEPDKCELLSPVTV